QVRRATRAGNIRNMRRQIIAALGVAALTIIAVLAGCQTNGGTAATSTTGAAKARGTAKVVDSRRLLAADSPDNAGVWMMYGRDYNEQRYSPLTQINADNVNRLGLAWYADLAERGGVYETTPVIVNGRIFVTSPWSKVYAFDAKTGK